MRSIYEKSFTLNYDKYLKVLNCIFLVENFKKKKGAAGQLLAGSASVKEGGSGEHDKSS